VEKIRVILISSVRPEPTSAGQIILYRHLVNQPEIDLEVYGKEPQKFSLSMILRRVLGRVAKLGGLFQVVVNSLWVLWGGRWIDAELPRQVEKDRKTVVMTVAHGDGFMAAQRFAKKHKLPLVVFFQDWWPDMADVPGFFRRILEKQFLDLARECSVGLCVCEGMRNALGAGKNLQVLPPISAKHEMAANMPKQLDRPTSPFRIIYSGNLDFDGEMLLEALQAFKGHPHIQLQVRGANPCWPEEAKKEMWDAGLWLDFAPRSELDAWLLSADAFLIPMVFDKKYRRRMETSFPSKLIEFAQFGKPLIIWGPEYCSAVQWGRKANRALCITENNPNRLRENVESMTKSQETIGNLVQGIQKAAQEEFCYLQLQSFFNHLINNSIKRQ
jgi:hypothetical protein